MDNVYVIEIEIMAPDEETAKQMVKEVDPKDMKVELIK